MWSFVASSSKRPQKRRVEGGGRVTPKGGAAPVPKRRADDVPDASSRYTPPVPLHLQESPRWIPILMFSLFALGMVVIFLHYVQVLLPGADSNWWLLAGLGSILAGIITATQYR
jgi:hypothetical protein